MLCAGAEIHAKPGLSPGQMEFDVGCRLVTHEGTGLLTTYEGLSLAGSQRHGVCVGGRVEWASGCT